MGYDLFWPSEDEANHRLQATADGVWRGFRSRRFKHMVKGDKSGGNPWQFFDLERDPWEMENMRGVPAYQAEIAHHHQFTL